MGLADLHIHTICSYDRAASVPAVLARAKKIGLNVITITDHDEIAGSLKARELASKYSVKVIPGIEITTREGYFSVTPLQLDLTAYRAITDLNTWHWDESSFETTLPEVKDKITFFHSD